MNRRFEIGEKSIQRRLVLGRPCLVVLKARREMQNVNELLWFSRRLRRLSSQRLNDDAEQRNDEPKIEIFHFESS